MNDIAIRKLHPSDYEKGFLNVLKSLTSVGEYPQKRFNEIYEEKLEAGHSIYIAIDKAIDKVVGTISYIKDRKFSRGGGRVMHIEDVVVDEKYQGKKIGNLLMKRVMEDFRRMRGCYKVILDCDRKVKGFYEKFGFRECGIQMEVRMEGESMESERESGCKRESRNGKEKESELENRERESNWKERESNWKEGESERGNSERGNSELEN